MFSGWKEQYYLIRMVILVFVIVSVQFFAICLILWIFTNNEHEVSSIYKRERSYYAYNVSQLIYYFTVISFFYLDTYHLVWNNS